VHHSKRKTPVVALVERGRKVRTRVTPDVTARNLKQAIIEMCDPSSRIMTDELMPYRGIGKHFALWARDGQPQFGRVRTRRHSHEHGRGLLVGPEVVNLQAGSQRQ
jgi:hypothetical protein